MSEYWTTEELPGIRWDPADEPPDDDPAEPRIQTVQPLEEYL